MMERIYKDGKDIVVIGKDGVEIFRERDSPDTREMAHMIYCSEHF